MRKPAHLRAEMRLPARHLAEIAVAHQHALFRRLPVDTKDLDHGIVVESGGEVVLVQPIGPKRALDVETVHGKADRAGDFRAGEAAGRLEIGAVEVQIAVVVGEAELHPIAARHAPARAKRRRA
jgi:hypothetical protein